MVFNIKRIPEVLGENLNPSFFLLNLNPNTASRANKDDKTSIIVTWLSLILIIFIAFILFKKRSMFK